MGEIKNCLMAILKESLKFALLAIILFLFLGTLAAYIIVYVLKTYETDAEILAIVAGFIIAIIIVVIGKKLHYSDKIVSINLKILNILKNRYFGEKKNDK